MVAGTRPAVLVVDMTREFVDGRYPTGHSESGAAAVKANARLLAVARTRGVPVFFTNAFPDPGYRPAPAELGRWKQSSVDLAPADLPPGDVIADELNPQPDEVVIHKGRKPSGFFGTPLIAHLLYDRVDTVVVTGMTTSGCVRATAVDAFQFNLNVLVPHECVADRSEISHLVNLFDLHMKYADVISLDETVEYLESLPARSR